MAATSSSASSATSPTTTLDGFTFPSCYEFPPFFTLQPVAETRMKQDALWVELILAFTRHFSMCEVNVLDVASNTALFHNKRLERRLTPEEITELFDALVERGVAEWVDRKSKDRLLIYWRQPSEWATLIYQWAEANGRVNAVTTIYDLRQGPSSQDQPFYKLDERVILKALSVLEKDQRAVVFEGDKTSAKGVKFFPA